MWEAITVIEAQEQLKKMNVMDWPNMKSSQRKKLHKELHSKAYGGELKAKNYVSLEDVQKALGR